MNSISKTYSIRKKSHIILITPTMKQFFFFLIIIFSLFVVSCEGEAQSDKSTTIAGNRIEVIDFYGAHRCVTCEAIEASAKYTVDTYFADEQKKGIVVFKTVDVDDDKNYDMAEAFEAAGTALFLNVVKNGVETHIDLTDFGFSKGKNQEVFSEELKIKIEAELKKL